MSNIIFDFDGTIADSLPVVMELFYEWAGIDPLSKTEVEKVKNMQAKDVFGYFGISIWKAPSLLVKGRSVLGKRVNDIPMFDGIEQVFKKLESDGHTMFLVSSNSTVNIKKFLKNNNIAEYFKAVQGNVGIFGKTNVLRAIVRKYKLNINDTYSIGDETRDIDAAKKMKITAIAVGWGYNGPKILKSHNPDFQVTKPSEILGIISK